MVDKYTVSVIVPVYNDAKYIDRCVSSIRKQTYKNLDIVLVDDGSKDESGSLCDGYARKDSRIHVQHKENGGLVSAWTAGFRSSVGEYVCFVDGDDWIEKDMIEKMAAYLVENSQSHDKRQNHDVNVEQNNAQSDNRNYSSGSELQVVCGGCVIDRPDGSSEKEGNRLAAGIYEGANAFDKIRKDILGNEIRTIIMSRCMKLISRELIEQNLLFTDAKVTMGEDVTIMLPALLDAKRIVIMKDACDYHYVYNTGSMVHAYDKGMLDGIHRLNAIIRQVFSEKHVENGTDQAQKEYLYLMMLVMKNELRNPDKSYSSNIRGICADEGLMGKMKETPIEVHDTANWMIANMMMHPQRWVIQAARIAMKRKVKQNLKA